MRSTACSKSNMGIVENFDFMHVDAPARILLKSVDAQHKIQVIAKNILIRILAARGIML